MPLDSRVDKIVKLMNALDREPADRTMVQRRAASAALARRGGALVMPKGPEPAQQRDVVIPVDGGQIVVRLYVPHVAGPVPLYVFLHGGGWCIGTLDERDPRCRTISAGANCVVASVDYRMAPENAYPTPPEDCYAALVWLSEHADELGIDATRIGIGGESAGANLAAAVCLMARDRSGPALRHQWLDVPAVDLTMSQPSIHSVPDGYLLDLDIILEFREAYLGSLDRMTEPYASPLLADDLSGLPPAWIMSCEFDKLRDDGVAYASALKEAGVPVESQILKGHVHPSFAFTRLIPSAKAYEREAIAALAKALHG
ncbi:alpha/beta hydrolase fold domain-containing protein [Aquihabitans sp. McL0605]|uniref:alpha/beta hydrolase n=1 Tax=Aquihabitans sp. McL0605 TaxID=3415671 RepID=UPI003CED0EE0